MVKKLKPLLHALGVDTASASVKLLLVLVPIVLLLGAWLWKNRSKLKWSKPSRPAVEPSVQSPPSVQVNDLRAGWRRFMRRLPRSYRRSILGFDHFLVLGDLASGKSLLVDRYTDWRRQAKQFLGAHASEANLDFYLGSRSVVTELAAAVLLDVGPKCRTALQRLWRPLYRLRPPVVVVALDVERLKRPDYDGVDLAERIRGKLNLLSGICKRPLEVRIVLTHLDASAGWEDFAQLCSSEKIPLWTAITCGAGQPAVEAQLDSWVVHARDHLGRALVKGGAARFRKSIAFLREVQALPQTVGRFADVLFAQEALSLSPRPGGIYLSCAHAGEPNPLRGVWSEAKAPDPRARHRIAALALSGLLLGYLGLAFHVQRQLKTAAVEALASYQPRRVDGALREVPPAVLGFVGGERSLIARFPDFYRPARSRLRAQLSGALRDQLLQNLKAVAADGSVSLADSGAPRTRARRALFYLALIHSDRSDPHEILGPSRLRAWAEMTQLSASLIRAYVEVTDGAFRGPADFVLPDRRDEHDRAAYWGELLRDISDALTRGTMTPDELRALQLRASEALASLRRFDHDPIVRGLVVGRLAALGGAELTTADVEGCKRESVERVGEPGVDAEPTAACLQASGVVRKLSTTSPLLHQDYAPLFTQLQETLGKADVNSSQSVLSEILELIRSAKIAAPKLEQVGALVQELERCDVTEAPATPSDKTKLGEGGVTSAGDTTCSDGCGDGAGAAAAAAAGEKTLQTDVAGAARPDVYSLRVAGETYVFRAKAWELLVKRVKARDLVTKFVQAHKQGSIFATPGSELTSVRWSATQSVPMFRGQAEIAPMYTRAGYEALVRQPIVRLEAALEKVELPTREAQVVGEYVARQVRSYADEYGSSLRRYYDSFSLAAGSAEALRVALSEMITDDSAYSAFLRSVCRQVSVDTSGELLRPMERKLQAYAGLQGLFDEYGSPAEIRGYRAILSQLLADLSAASEITGQDPAAEPELSGAAGVTGTLQSALGPAGKIALPSLRGDKGSYASQVQAWRHALKLHDSLQVPFLAPIFVLDELGLREIATTVSDTWNTQVFPDVKRINGKFPFDDDPAAADVSPSELHALLNPTTGRIRTFVEKYLGPLAVGEGSASFQLRPELRDRLALAAGMLSTIRAAEKLSARLYDDKGRPSPLKLEVATVPFEHGRDPRLGLTLVYMSVGEALVNNFNQRPALSTLRIDWTREQVSQVGVQLTNLDTQEHLFPKPIATAMSYWSALRLLKAAASSKKAKKPVDAQVYLWNVPHSSAGSAKTPVRFAIVSNPWELFRLDARDDAVAWR